MRVEAPSAAALGLQNSICSALLLRSDMDPMEQLVVLCQIVGGLVAVQDSTLPVTTIMEVVGKNIEIGNEIALSGALNPGLKN